jgi:hypothetical protein
MFCDIHCHLRFAFTTPDCGSNCRKICRSQYSNNNVHILYRVIHKYLWEFRPLWYSSRDGHAGREHVNSGTDTPKFLSYLTGARYIHLWSILTKVCRTRSTVLTAHRQPLCWNFMYHSRIVFVCMWFCVVHGPKPPFHRHNWLSFGKFQQTERFLIHCPRHVASRLPPSGETYKYAMTPITQANLDRFSTYWYAHLCCICLRFCAAEIGNSGETYELACIINVKNHSDCYT